MEEIEEEYMVSVDDYNKVNDCIYKDEHYSVRDNGAIMRHKREGKPKRKYDESWSFGIPNPQTGYMMFCNERVHRIVATAFHGPAPTPDHVVDHIDTNRQNNRLENLRWLTRLENALNNPITRKKIEFICGSVEAFLENPQILYLTGTCPLSDMIWVEGWCEDQESFITEWGQECIMLLTNHKGDFYTLILTK